MSPHRVGLLLSLALLAGCASPQSGAVPASPSERAFYPGPPHVVVEATAPALPPVPGATNTAVAPSAILSTICVSGYTAKVRPPASYTDRLKLMQMGPNAPGLTIRAPNGRTYPVVGFNLPGRPADYEEDHLVSLEADGDPYDPRNLYPEPWEGPYGAKAKDVVENRVHAAICSRRISPDEGARILAGKWWESPV